MNLLATAQRLSRNALERQRLGAAEREARRVARDGAQAHMRDLVWAATQRDALRAELATAQARLEVLERMLREVGEALARHDAADAIVSAKAPHWSHVAIVARAEALGVLLANVAIAVRFACQTPVVEETA